MLNICCHIVQSITYCKIFLQSLAHERTLADQMREDELLSDILNYVTRRSNIVEKMDEDRLRWVIWTKSVVCRETSFRVENKISRVSLTGAKWELLNSKASFKINGGSCWHFVTWPFFFEWKIEASHCASSFLSPTVKEAVLSGY